LLALVVPTIVLAGADPAETAAAGTTEAALTAESAYRELINDQGEKPTGEWLERAGALFEQAQRGATKDGRWKMGAALVLRKQDERTKSRKLAEAAIKLTPDDADMQYWAGTMIFENIQDFGFLDKAALSKRGRKAYERAVELDATHVEARMGLAQFYLYAPGIAGGSETKARELAEEISQIEGGAFEGSLLLGQIEAKNENWDACEDIFQKAADGADNNEDRLNALLIAGQILLWRAKDAERALTFIEQAVEVAPPGGVTPIYVLGVARMEMGQLDDALACFRIVLEREPNSGNTHHRVAEICASQGQHAEAVTHYERFIELAPEDDRVKQAKKEIRRLK
jgi:tetratricopeptide (TPR) repeat protein